MKLSSLLAALPLLAAAARAEHHEPITIREVYEQEHQGRSLRAGPKPADAPFHVQRDLQAPTCVYENGLYNGYTNAYPNGLETAFGRLALLDDFTVPAGETLKVEGIRWGHFWNYAPNVGTSLEIFFRADADAGGAPGDPITGLIQISNYQETPADENGVPIKQSIATFDTTQVFGPGTYWLEAAIVGPEISYWLVTTTVTGAHSWPDADGDGVPDDEDSCPGTAAGDPVDEDGCSPDQLAPCEGNGGPWKNHGEYLKFFALAAEELVDAGTITKEKKDALVAAAGESDCGRNEPVRRQVRRG